MKARPDCYEIMKNHIQKVERNIDIPDNYNIPKIKKLGCLNVICIFIQRIWALKKILIDAYDGKNKTNI